MDWKREENCLNVEVVIKAWMAQNKTALHASLIEEDALMDVVSIQHFETDNF